MHGWTHPGATHFAEINRNRHSLIASNDSTSSSLTVTLIMRIVRIYWAGLSGSIPTRAEKLLFEPILLIAQAKRHFKLLYTIVVSLFIAHHLSSGNVSCPDADFSLPLPLLNVSIPLLLIGFECLSHVGSNPLGPQQHVDRKCPVQLHNLEIIICLPII